MMMMMIVFEFLVCNLHVSYCVTF